jgi:glutaredoxin
MHDPRSLIRIDIYSRPGCHLCHEARERIKSVTRGRNVAIRMIDIDRDPALEAEYRTTIPVVFINDEKVFQYHVDTEELENRLKELWKT